MAYGILYVSIGHAIHIPSGDNPSEWDLKNNFLLVRNYSPVI